jgi:putative DNA primase/helicase
MNAYNPVADWIDSKPWDGVQRIGDLAKTLKCKDPENSEQCEKLLRRWLISCAAALVHQGLWCKGVLTLQGGQDLGKTSWFRRLVPAELGAFREGVSLDPNNKDSVTTAVSHWIVELGELESTLRREIESLKAFITQTVDRLRRPYDRLDSEYPRRTVFCASVNSDRFLKDETGNDRFWVIEVVEVNHKHDVDMQQLWAEVMALYRSGEQWHLDIDEKKQLTETNAQFRQVSPFEELLLARFSIAGAGGKHMSASQILIELGYDRPTRAQATEAGQVLSRLGATSKKSAGSKQYYLCPLSCSDNSPI